MGRLSGHILPGSFFIAFGLWWIWSVLHRYFTCQKFYSRDSCEPDSNKIRASKYRNTASFTCGSCCTKVHVEGVVKVFATTVGFTGELITAFKDGKFVNVGNSQHMAMYFFFGMNGIMDMLQFHGLALIPGMDYMSALLALLVEAFLFSNHLHGRLPLDVQLHVFLLYAILGTVISGLCEIRFKNSVLPALARIFFTLLHGTWFYQVGFILYPPSGNHWDENSHSQMMITTTLFTIHMAAIFIFMSVATALIFLSVRANDSSSGYEVLQTRVSQVTAARRAKAEKKYDVEQVKSIIADSEEEVEDAEL